MKQTLFIVALGAFVALGAPAFAQTPATPAASGATAAPAGGSMAKKAAKPRTAVSLACSKAADGKNIHGKSRKKFLSSCKKAGGPA